MQEAGEPDRVNRACTFSAADLAAGPRPIVQFGAAASIVIIGQVRGKPVRESDIRWDDASGERLRHWTGLTSDVFYDSARVVLVPMDFRSAGTSTSGDLPHEAEVSRSQRRERRSWGAVCHWVARRRDFVCTGSFHVSLRIDCAIVAVIGRGWR
ncbi:MAG: hypothetical protein K2Y20_01175 [Sphingomonas sp.]|nr:hypothetical protein [Sphingomonas sp.]